MRDGFQDEEVLAVVDPDDGRPEELDRLEPDAVLVGGSKDVDAEDALREGKKLREIYPGKSIYQEPGHPRQVSHDTMELFDGLIVSTALNGDRDAVVGKHIEFFSEIDREARMKAEEKTGILSSLPYVEDFADSRADDRINSLLDDTYIPQSYIVMNPDCDAADVAGVEPEDIPGEREMRSLARLAEHHLNSPILYVEGSGDYVEPGLVEEAANQLDRTHLRYGGGIENGDQVDEMLEAGADSVVIGSALEEGSYSTT